MSNQIEQPTTGQEEKIYQKNGNTFHHDKYGDWWINQNGTLEYLFLNQIDDYDLSEQVADHLKDPENQNKSEFPFVHDGQDFYIYVNFEDKEQTKLSRKITTQLPKENVYNKLEQAKPASNFGQAMNQATGKTGNSSNNLVNMNNNRSMYVTDSTKWIKQTLEEAQQQFNYDPYWSIDKETSPNCFQLMGEDGILYIWTKLAHKKKLPS